MRVRELLGAIGAGTVLFASGCSAQGYSQPVPAPGSILETEADFDRAWPDDRAGQAWLTPQGYQLFARTPGRFVAVRARIPSLPQDIVVNGTFRKVGGPPGGGYGLIVSDQSVSAGDGQDQAGEYVVAGVGDRGEIGIWRRAGDRWLDLVPWTPTNAVQSGWASNDLSVSVRNTQLTFTVNGTRVATVDTGLKPGSVGVFTGGDLNQVVASHFSVRPAPPNVQAPNSPRPTRPAVAAPSSAEVGPAASARGGLETGLYAARRVRDLLSGIYDDVGGILGSFAGGFDSPNPVTDPIVLKDDSHLLDGATQKVEQLRVELSRLRDEGAPGGR